MGGAFRISHLVFVYDNLKVRMQHVIGFMMICNKNFIPTFDTAWLTSKDYKLKKVL
jgi:hypothetical protein